LLVWFTAGLASAGQWLVESPGVADRGALKAAEAAGLEGGFETSVVRRAEESGRPQYVAQFEGFSDPAEAKAAAVVLAAKTGLRMTVAYSEEGTQVVLESVEPAPRGPRPAADLPGAALLPVIEAHGGDAARLELVRKGPLRFQFRRELSTGLVVDHLWEARGGDLYCSVDVVAGKGRSTVTRIVGDVAEMSVDGGPFRREDPVRVRRVLEALGPAEVVPLVLGLATAASSRSELQGLAPAGTASADGVPTTVLQAPASQSAPALELQVGRVDHLVRVVKWADGAVVHELSDYRKEGGVPVPHTIRTTRADGDDDQVTVTALVFNPKPDPAHFRLVSPPATR
jgi:hypothetical protein